MRRGGSGLRAGVRGVTSAALLLIALLVGASFPGAAVAAAPLVQGGGVCGEATRLIAAGRPSEALNLIALHRGTDAAAATSAGALPEDYFPKDACRDQRELALTHIARAEAYTALAAELSKKERAPADDSAVTSTEPVSVAVGCPALDDVGDLTAEQAEMLAQQCNRGEVKEEESGILADLDAGWEAAKEDVVAPLGSLALPVAAVVLALLVIARLVVPMVPRWPTVDRSRSAWLLLIAVPTILVAAVTLVAGLLEDLPAMLPVPLIALAVATLLVSTFALAILIHPPGGWAAATVAAVVGAAIVGSSIGLTTRRGLLLLALPLMFTAVSLVAIEMATRLRLSISVRGSGETPKETEVGHVVALLEEMGGASPRGLEIPRGADVTALTSSVITADPAGAVAKALWSAWQLLVSPVPWRIQVDEDSGGRLNVVVTRNGRAASAVVVDPKELLALDTLEPENGGRTPDLYRFVAAAVLVTLDRHHGLRGMHGVSDWRSLGYHCVATLDLGPGEARKETLARALVAQPQNLPAQLALQVSLFRDSSDKDQLERFATWLGAFISRLPGGDAESMALALRAHNMRVTSLVNAWFAGPPPWPPLGAALETPVKDFADAVAEAKRRVPPGAPAYPFVKQMEARQQWLADAYVKGEVTPDNCTPDGAYAGACFTSSVDWAPAEALTLLELADVDPDLRTWRSKDPQLQRLRQYPEYARRFPRQPEKDPFTLAPLGSLRTRLTWHGLDDVATLADFSDRERDLSQLIDVPIQTTRRLVMTSRVVTALSDTLPDHAVEITHELLRRGVADLSLLSSKSWREQSLLAQHVTTTLAARLDLPKTFLARLSRWLRAL